MRIIDLGRIETDFNVLIQTVSGLMDRVSKLEIKTANLYEQGKGGLVQSTAFNLDLSNLDTKKEHALRLQLRDTKEQFKQLEDAHRKLVKAHKTLQKSYSEKEKQWNNLSDALIRKNEDFDLIAEDRANFADKYRELQGKFSAVLQEEMRVNKILWEENRKLKGGSMLSRIVCDIATIIEHSDADSFTESIAKNLLNYINGGGR